MGDKALTVNFKKKFSIVVEAKLGKYSFENRSFPIVDRGEVIESIGDLSTGASLWVRGFDTKRPVNAADFSWSLPMSMNEAMALVKGLEIERSEPGNLTGEFQPVVVRLTYSVLDQRGALSDTQIDGFPAKRYVLSLTIHTAEVFTDHSLTKKLGVIPKITH